MDWKGKKNFCFWKIEDTIKHIELENLIFLFSICNISNPTGWKKNILFNEKASLFSSQAVAPVSVTPIVEISVA